MKYPNRLRVIRAERACSQLDTALKAKITEGRYWRIENGYVVPTEDERARIAAALKVPVADLERAAS